MSLPAPVPPAASSADRALGLLVEELTAKLQAGVPVDVQAYVEGHPEHAERLRQLLPALRLLGDLGRSAAAGISAGIPPAEVPQDLVGTLGDYRILREVGRGGMGVVYEAEQVSLGRRVALKLLPFAAALDPRQLQRFHNEARAAAGLHHTNIVPVYAVGQERGVHYYAMQFIDGSTLADFIAQQRHEAVPQTPTVAEAEAAAAAATTAPPAAQATSAAPREAAYFRRAAEWGIQAAEALDCAHVLGVVHRDVKPANLLVDGSGRLWVTDFGLAQVQSDARLTLTGDLVGTLRYMSPEQALAKRVVVDHRTDVYSLGATLYEVLTLQPVYGGTDRQELLRQIAFEEPKAPRRLNKAVPAELETVVLKAVEKAPQDRYATAQELADDLRRFLDDRPIHARRPTLLHRARKWSRRHRAVVWSAAVCCLVTVAVVGASIGWVAGEKAARRAEAARGFEDALGRALGLMAEDNWPEAKAATQRAAGLLHGAGGDPALQRRLEQAETDLDMAARLELSQLAGAAGVIDDHFDWSAVDDAYTDAFRSYNLPVLEMEPDEAARRVVASAIREQLLAALVAWAKVHPDRATREKLVAVAWRADPDPWRRQLLGALAHNDGPRLAQLAQQPGALDQPPARLAVLANVLAQTDLPAGLQFYRQAQQRHPDNFWLNHQLGYFLMRRKPPQLDEAIGFFRVALALRRHSPGVHLNLAQALLDRGRLAEAEAEGREAIRLKGDYATAHNNLGYVLASEGRFDDAISAFQEAIHFKQDFAEAYCGLARCLGETGRLDAAIAAAREAIRVKPGYYLGHDQLAVALAEKGRWDEARAAFEEAIRLNPENANSLYGLGNALAQERRMDEAIDAYRKAICLKPDYFQAYNNLGNALGDVGRRDEAIATYRAVLRLKPDYANAHYGLGFQLLQGGRFEEAVAAFEDTLRSQPDYAKARPALAHARELVALNARLTKVLSGEARPASTAERVRLALACAQPARQLTATAARFYAEALAAEPRLADDLGSGHRYNAACAAALAGCGRGKDAGGLSDPERDGLRRQARAWLRADLQAWRRLLDSGPEKNRPAIAQQLAHWLEDRGFAGVRGEQALARLPAAERPEWQKLWQEVEALRQRAARPPDKPVSSRP
jgi:serine/threonine protein kinase/Flp pilus assembly protein TadD